MSLISRPVKSGGQTTYTAEVAVGVTDAFAEEVDADLDTIYQDYDGNITDDNISPVAGIQGGKLANGTITDTQLATNAVTTTKLQDGAVTAIKLATGAVGLGNQVAATPGVYTTEATVVSIPLTVDAAGSLFVGGSIGWNAGGGSGMVRLRWKLDGTTFLITDFDSPPANSPLPTPSGIGVVGVGAHTIILTAEGVSAQSIDVPATNPGSAYAIRLR